MSAPPATLKEAYGLVLDLTGRVGGLAASARWETGVKLSPEAVRHLVEAHESLKAAHREIEAALYAASAGAAAADPCATCGGPGHVRSSCEPYGIAPCPACRPGGAS